MDLKNIKAIILDIEGTTTSISFVKDVLFPYVTRNINNYLEKNWETDEVQEDVRLLKEQADRDKENQVKGLIPIQEGEDLKQSVIKNVMWQMESDRKTTALKQLQGHVWREGYALGYLKGHVYDDVAGVLQHLRQKGLHLYVYSSGSVEAQKLLFYYSNAGNLLSSFAGHFDTTIGPKVAKESYASIAKEIGLKPEEILFLTDVFQEAEASRLAGMHAVLVIREGNAALSPLQRQHFPIISSLSELVTTSMS